MSAFFSKADVQKHPFRLSLNVCFRPKAVIRINSDSLNNMHAAVADRNGVCRLRLNKPKNRASVTPSVYAGCRAGLRGPLILV